MESAAKRLKPTSPNEDQDFVAFGSDNEDDRYGFNGEAPGSPPTANTPREPRTTRHDPRVHNDKRHALDRPKSSHPLAGHEPWLLVKTKYNRRFVHNTTTKESLWRVPQAIWGAVRELEEKDRNAEWAERELKRMRIGGGGSENAGTKVERGPVSGANGVAVTGRRRRRSESLQREDEEAMMAELAAEAELRDGDSKKEAVVKTLALEAGDVGYDSDGSYEYVEVTDDEGEEGTARDAPAEAGVMEDAEQDEEGPVEFGEDDIAYQLAAMGKEYGLDPEEYGDGDEDEEGFVLSEADATALFCDLLDDHGVSPFTPWDKLIADDSPTSILHEDRFTVLPSTRARKEVWDLWVTDTAARLKEERSKMEKRDPRIPYLTFLHANASLKLYWPEFKRKYKREAEMNDRNFSDKEREKLYREHVNRLKLSEGTRKADLTILLKSVPLRDLNQDTRLEALPQQLLTHLHFISLPASTRDRHVAEHIATLAPRPSGDEADQAVDKAESEKRRKRDAALEARRRQVEDERMRAEKEERFARKDLRAGEEELRRATQVRGQGIGSLLGT